MLTLSKNGNTKNVLKDICKDVYNEDFAYRKKMGFAIPLKSFMSDDSFIEEWNSSIVKSMKKRNLFNIKQDGISKKDIAQMSQVEVEGLWLVYSFEVWAQKYLD